MEELLRPETSVAAGCQGETSRGQSWGLKDVCMMKAWHRGASGAASLPWGSDLELEKPGLGLAQMKKPLSQGSESIGQQVFKEHWHMCIQGGDGGGKGVGTVPVLSRAGLMASPLALQGRRAHRAVK